MQSNIFSRTKGNYLYVEDPNHEFGNAFLNTLGGILRQDKQV
jgi:hypothetical protein